MDAVELTWDDNENLVDDGVSEYVYDHANRLVAVTQGLDTYAYSYNGLGDQLTQTVNSSPTDYSLDLAAGLTQVLADGTNAYLYGLARLGEEQPGGWQYHLGDALGSVRQLADAAEPIAYDPTSIVWLAIRSGRLTALKYSRKREISGAGAERRSSNHRYPIG